ncbi:MAG TPA: NfeD family protein [Phycisphaerales bacterium]|nr:NfeD family protein [Phycisphaerales bacterium]
MLSELFQSPAVWFTLPALLGTGIFVLKLGAVLIGLDHHGDSSGADAHGHDSGDAVDATGSFKLVSVQAAFGFIMGFGWCGLVCLKAFEWTPSVSVLGGLVGGSAFAFLVALLLNATRRLETSGNVNMNAAVGNEAVVYATVPAKGEGRGQVRVVIGTRDRIVQATSEGPAIKTGDRVKVVHAHADSSIIVTPV